MRLGSCTHVYPLPFLSQTLMQCKDRLKTILQRICDAAATGFRSLKSASWSLNQFFHRLPCPSKPFAPLSFRDRIFKSCGNGSTLHQAAFHSHHHQLADLLAAQHSPHAKTQDLVTPLHVAAYKGNLEGIKLLLAAGASTEARDMLGQTPIHWAAYKGHVAALNLLFIFGADIDARDSQAKTPLHLAVKPGHLDAASTLLVLGADKDAKDYKQRTPYFIAMLHGHRPIAQYLADVGAKTDITDDKGDTATNVLGQACLRAYLRQFMPMRRHELNASLRRDLLTQVVMIA